jgi:acyl-coenzyme A thioesterase PaaI-like protein
METPTIDPAALGWSPELAPGDDFMHLVGPLLWRMDGQTKRYAFLAEQKHMSRFRRLHGAMLLFLADKAMSVTAWELVGRPQLFATIQLDMQFLGTVPRDCLVEAHCELIRKTGSLAFMSARLAVGDQLVAAATGVWKYTRTEG